MLNGKLVYLDTAIPVQARAWRNTRDIWRWCRQNTLLSMNDHAKWLERIQADPTIKMFGIWLDHSHPVGVCGLTSIDRVNQNAEFSLYIAPEHQRKGYAKDALKTLLSHGFNDLNLERVWGETYDGNPALKMFLGLGMKHEGTQRRAYFRDGKFIDCHRVAVLRGEWNGMANRATGPYCAATGGFTGDLSCPQAGELNRNWTVTTTPV